MISSARNTQAAFEEHAPKKIPNIPMRIFYEEKPLDAEGFTKNM